MNTFRFSARSEQRLQGVHPDLVRVMRRALELSPLDFVIVEGRRSIVRQAELLKAGASQTMDSRHLTGHAVDIAPIVMGQVRWDWPLFHQLAPAVKKAAAELGVSIDWGGDWTTLKDGPHFQLNRKAYP